MKISRRHALALAAGGSALLAFPRLALAVETNPMFAEFQGAEASSDGITLTAPEIAENGNTVPIEVDAPGATAIAVYAMGNPNPEVAIFQFGPLAAEQSAQTRIRLAGTQDVVAVAQMDDGSFRRASREVKVTIGGCGG
jgi:sulfur-oxidizing protein SoxY